jgi:Type IV secretion-system coupling protein DNA-binding domain
VAINPYGTSAEQLTRHFHAWERRGRGWDVYPAPVALEPPFRPFPGHYVWQLPFSDDGRSPGFFASIFGSGRKDKPPKAALIDPEEPAPRPVLLPAELTELRVLLPEKFELQKDAAEQLLLTLRFCLQPVSFELIATASRIALQFAAREEDYAHVLQQLQSFAPSASIITGADYLYLATTWFEREDESLIVDLGLSEEFMRPLRGLRTFAVDPLVAVIGALGALSTDEVAVVQVLFQAADEPWSESIMQAVVDPEGKPFFATGPECVKQAGAKVAKPLFAVRPRLAVQARSRDRRLLLLRSLMGTLSQFEQPGSNELIALDSEGWSDDDQLDDLLFRAAHRSGILLNVEELAALVHLPSAQVVSARFERHTKRTKEAPTLVRAGGVLLGSNEHAGNVLPVRLSQDVRVRHTYVIGGTGTGKSTLLLNLILQDIEAGRGVAVLDPHGDLIDGITARMKDDRIADVVLINPADEEFPVGLNILTAHSEIEKTLLSSDLISVFRRLSTSWGDQMNAVLGNALLAFLESSTGGTLLDLRRFLVDKEFRKHFLATVGDSEVVYFWEKEFPLLIGRAASPLLTRLDTFLRPKLIRNMVAQRRSLDFRQLIDGRKILLAKLSQGAIGEENAYLLGTLLVSKLHQVALSRADTEEAAREDFFLYVDEFHHFATPSMDSLLSGVRKYRIGLTLAHQSLSQLGGSTDPLVSSVLANASTRICFRIGDQDAKRLADGFSFFEARDLQNLGVGEALLRVERAENDFNLRTEILSELDPALARTQTGLVVASSRERYATPRGELPASPLAPPASEPDAPTPPVLAASAVELPRPQPASETGRGGKQHRYLQTLIKRLGEERGFRASLEVPVLAGTGNIDVVLERGDFRVACEITVTTPTGHEVGNLQKCLAADHERVVLVSPTSRNLGRVRRRAVEVFTSDELARIHFALPEELPTLLDQLNIPAATVETISGYDVKVQFRAPDEGVKEKTETIRNILGRSLRRSKE